ncbi:MAG: MerR family transcriptional regulator [Candidatus Omnitrophota bacterium]
MIQKVKNNIQNNKAVSAKDIMQMHSISYQTLNHYTNFGLLPVLLKKGNVRFYDKAVVEKRIVKIRELMEEGYSLQLIRKRFIGI